MNRQVFGILALVLVACGEPDEVDCSVVWSWSFIDPATNADVDCPADVSSVDLLVYEHVKPGGECTSTRSQLVTSATYACSRGNGSLLPMPTSNTSCRFPDSYMVRVVPHTSGGQTYADEGELVDLSPDEVVHGHTDIAARRGYIRLSWTVVAADGTTPIACPLGSAVKVSLDSWLRAQGIDCRDGAAILPGIVPGTYDFSVSLSPDSGDGGVEVSGAAVSADAITDVAVTFVL